MWSRGREMQTVLWVWEQGLARQAAREPQIQAQELDGLVDCVLWAEEPGLEAHKPEVRQILRPLVMMLVETGVESRPRPALAQNEWIRSAYVTLEILVPELCE